MKLNYGAGEVKLEDFINIDIEPSVNSDLVCDIRKSPLPFKDNEIEALWASHVIEHVEYKYWIQMFKEFQRVLVPKGELLLAYPEFEVCTRYYIENYRGMRDFWRATIYGRQNYPGDYHVTPVITGQLVSFLRDFGFYDIKFGPEPDGPHFTMLICKKGSFPLTKPDVFKIEVFGESFQRPAQERFSKK